MLAAEMLKRCTGLLPFTNVLDAAVPVAELSWLVGTAMSKPHG